MFLDVDSLGEAVIVAGGGAVLAAVWLVVVFMALTDFMGWLDRSNGQED